MILVALGANLPSPKHGPPQETLAAALGALERAGVRIERCSRWYETAPVPLSDQPWYVNGVAAVASELEPAPLLARLHAVEADFGRERSRPNEPRILDLDLIAYGQAVSSGWPVLPHPRLHERAFVLRPLAEVAPEWRHPVTGRSVAEMLGAIDPGQTTRLLGGQP